MSSNTQKEVPPMAYPKTLLSIAASVGGLAIFLILASTLLISQPIGSTVRGYFYAVDHTSNVDPMNRVDKLHQSDGKGSADEALRDLNSKNSASGDSVVNSEDNNEKGIEQSKNQSLETNKENELSDVEKGGMNISSSGPAIQSGSDDLSNVTHQENGTGVSGLSNVTENGENTKPTSPALGLSDDTKQQKSNISLAESGCNLYNGKWVYDSTGPLYSNNSCPVLSQMQNCQGNGRPDKDYENWRWKPAHCDLPRFDAKKFLELMKGKTLAFIGDSVARNQMESMLCILWQVEAPKNRGNKKMQRYYFRSTSTMIVRIWSSWLVHLTSEPFDSAPAGVDKLHLDAPDEHFMEFIPTFDVIVLSSGHWFAKKSVYILNNEIVGGQLWQPEKSIQRKINNIEAFGISVETILTAMAKHPNYTGLTILRSFSPDHYEGGAWNTGGSCTGKVKPVADGELVENGFTNIMHEKQVGGFNQAIKKQTNKSKLILMDITDAFSYRHDGHPGPYRSPDPNKITKRGPDGRPPPQDCLHWCMPGPVDTWNELVFEITRREFEARQNNLS